MIIKSFEINKINFKKINFFLLYGENEGLKNEIIKKEFENKFNQNVLKYDEKEVLDNKENLSNEIFIRSFFNKEKLLIISRCTDKIHDFIEEIIDKNIIDIKIVLNSGILDKKSKLRKTFEKKPNTACIPFYSDNFQTLSKIVNSFFYKAKIQMSQESINLLINRCSGDRLNLNNELKKIESYIVGNKKIDFEEILKLTNLAENFNTSELIDNCLSKNHKKTVNILNENNFSSEDSILIIKTLLNRSKRLLDLKRKSELNKNLEECISSYKPPIFWKDKDIVKQQMNNWSLKNIENLIYEINEIELLAKKNLSNSLNIISDFLINQSSKLSN